MSLANLQLEIAIKNNNKEEMFRIYKNMLSNEHTRNKGLLGQASMLKNSYSTIFEAKNILEDMHPTSKDVNRKVWYELAKIELLLGNYSKANHYVSKLLNGPSRSKILRILINVYSALEQKNVDKILTTKEKDQLASYLGIYYKNCGEYDKAIEIYKQMLNKNCENALQALFGIYYKIGEKKLMDETYEKLSICSPIYKTNLLADVVNNNPDSKYYFMQQKNAYSHDRLMEHIAKHLEGNDDKSYIYTKFDISEKIKIIEKRIDVKTYYTPKISDINIIEFNEPVGEVEGFVSNKLEVISHANTNKIITMFPHISKFPINTNREENYEFILNLKKRGK